MHHFVFIPQPSHTVCIKSLNSVAGTITLDNVRTNVLINIQSCINDRKTIILSYEQLLKTNNSFKSKQ